MKTIEEAKLYEAVEDLIYENCNKDTLNIDEYEKEKGIDLRKYIDIKGILHCIKSLNQTNN